MAAAGEYEVVVGVVPQVEVDAMEDMKVVVTVAEMMVAVVSVVLLVAKEEVEGMVETLVMEGDVLEN